MLLAAACTQFNPVHNTLRIVWLSAPARRPHYFLKLIACAAPTAIALVGSRITVNELNPGALVLVDN